MSWSNELSTPNLAGLFSGRPVGRDKARRPRRNPRLRRRRRRPRRRRPRCRRQRRQRCHGGSGGDGAGRSGGNGADGGRRRCSGTDDSAPTAESVFGPTPWVTNPTGTAPDGSSYGYNPMYFASAATAAKVAQMVGGKVVTSNQFTSSDGPFQQQQPNEMVQLANGTLINPGLVAGFYTHGYPQSYIDFLVQNEIQGT